MTDASLRSIHGELLGCSGKSSMLTFLCPHQQTAEIFRQFNSKPLRRSQGRLLMIVFVIHEPRAAISHGEKRTRYFAPVCSAAMPQPVIPKHTRAFAHERLVPLFS